MFVMPKTRNIFFCRPVYYSWNRGNFLPPLFLPYKIRGILFRFPVCYSWNSAGIAPIRSQRLLGNFFTIHLPRVSETGPHTLSSLSNEHSSPFFPICIYACALWFRSSFSRPARCLEKFPLSWICLRKRGRKNVAIVPSQGSKGKKNFLGEFRAYLWIRREKMSIDYSPAAACRGCKKSVDAKNAYFCPTCGDCICADCAKKNNGVCRRCFSPLERFSWFSRVLFPDPFFSIRPILFLRAKRIAKRN